VIPEISHREVRATATLTLALPKTGLFAPGTSEPVGELFLTDIYVPPELYRRAGLELEVGPIFAEGDILKIV
jgi:NAD(P)H-hydrate epimerase